MKISNALKLTCLALSGLAIFGLLGSTSHKVSAQTKQQIQGALPTQNSAAKAQATVSYVAQPGDSYTQIARKAIQAYGKKYKVDIDPAGIIYAETNLTQLAGSPLLEISQKVQIKESVIKDWVNKANRLTSAEKSAWAYYVQFVNFNTDKVGQAS